MNERKCKSCLVTDIMPGISVDRSGECNLCREWRDNPKSSTLQEARRRDFERDLEETLTQCVSQSSSEYDCIVSFSGGKDSCYLLHRLVNDYGLKVLAYVSDFDIPETTWDSIHRTLRILNVECVVETPSREFYRRFIRYLLMNQLPEGAVHTVCYFWLDIREGDLLRLACERGISLIFTGYSPGQPEPSRMLYEMPPERIARSWEPTPMFEQGVFHAEERAKFWDPSRDCPTGKLPRILAPFHAWTYDQSEVTRRVCELGLVKTRWNANPVVSNFSLNWLFMYSDLKNLGYNPYKMEFSQLIREGRAKRRVWSRLFDAIDMMAKKRLLFGRNVDRGLEWLGIDEAHLQMRSASDSLYNRSGSHGARWAGQ